MISYFFCKCDVTPITARIVLDNIPPGSNWWLAGGITAEYIHNILARVQPMGIDASSRLETRPGWKDLARVQDLVDTVRAYTS